MYRVIGKGNANVILLDENNPAVVVRLAYAARKTEDTEGINSVVWCSRFPTLLAGLHAVMPSHELGHFVHNLGKQAVHKAALVAHSDWVVAGDTAMGMVLPNMLWLPDSASTYTVEIKPKCGFVPQTPFIHPDNRIKLTTCRYQLHQHLKIEKGTVSALSSYVPMDLFSAQKDRQKSALFALLENSQNNFKFWLNGQSQTLPTQHRKHAIDGRAELSWTSLIDVLLSILRTSSVLDAILAVQLLDQWDIEGIYPLYCHAIHHFENGPEHHDEESMCEDLWTCAWFQHWHDDHNDSCSSKEHCQWRAAHVSMHQSSWKNVISILRQYLIAMAAKDCSIMCSFTTADHTRPVSTSCHQAEQYPMSPAMQASTGEECSVCKKAASSLPRSCAEVHTCCDVLETAKHTVRYRIAIMDLDRKHVCRIGIQRKLDQAILDCCGRKRLSNAMPPA